MQYNLYIHTFSDNYNILDIDDTGLAKIVQAYNHGKDVFFLKGKKYSISNLIEIQIFTSEHGVLKSEGEIYSFCENKGLLSKDLWGWSDWVPIDFLLKLGKNVTGDFITDDYGHLKQRKTVAGDMTVYVDLKRIEDLNNLDNTKFDFTKLITFLEELNIGYENGQLLAIPLLVRAIIDHIPPVFQKRKFEDVISGSGTRSFKDIMNHLHKSSRKIADSYLHTTIRRIENLPNHTQINFKNDLDVLLQEIIRISQE